MKKLSIAVVLLLSVITFANAQERPQGGRTMGTPEERAQKQTEMLGAKLNLTADQKAKVEAIFLAQAKSVDSLKKASEGADPKSMRGKMQPIQKASESKFMAVLNDEQKKQYAAFQEERKSKMQGGANAPKKKKGKK